MDPQSASELFTTTSLLSLQGSAAAALLVPAVLQFLIGDSFKPYAKWVSFAIAILLSYLVAILASDTSPVKWILAFFNGFLVFASAVGINQAAASQGGSTVRPSAMPGNARSARKAPLPPQPKRFFASWF